MDEQRWRKKRVRAASGAKPVGAALGRLGRSLEAPAGGLVEPTNTLFFLLAADAVFFSRLFDQYLIWRCPISPAATGCRSQSESSACTDSKSAKNGQRNLWNSERRGRKKFPCRSACSDRGKLDCWPRRGAAVFLPRFGPFGACWRRLRQWAFRSPWVGGAVRRCRTRRPRCPVGGGGVVCGAFGRRSASACQRRRGDPD